MRFIHTSDLHINSPLTSHLSPAKTRERKNELYLSFRALVDEARSEGADGIIIAGDLFDSARASARVIDAVLSVIERAGDVIFFYLPGNHEKNLIESAVKDLPKNLKIFGENWTCFDFGTVRIAGRSETEENMFLTLSLDETKRTVLVLHGELSEHSGKGGLIGTRELEGLNVDYLALGHYHSYSARHVGKCAAVYCGTPEGRGFDETGKKGYVVVDFDSMGVSFSFKARAKRTLHSVDVDISAASSQYDIERLTERALLGTHSADLVRVNLVGEYVMGLNRDLKSLEYAFESGFYYFEARDSSRLKINPEDYVNDKSLKGEFIRLVLKDESLTDTEKSEIIECGLNALLGEKSARRGAV